MNSFSNYWAMQGCRVTGDSEQERAEQHFKAGRQSSFTTRCSVCGKEYLNGAGSTECCGGMHVVALRPDWDQASASQGPELVQAQPGPTDEQMRVAIAEACGWSRVSKPFGNQTGWNWLHTSGDYARNGDGVFGWGWASSKDSMQGLPDYLNDLNAMHEAEKVLTKEQCYEFDRQLNDSTFYPGENAPLCAEYQWHATARQRAIAFLGVVKPELFQ